MVAASKFSKAYNFTGNNVTSYFRSAANRINMFLVHVMFGSHFLNDSTDSEKVYGFGNYG